jgi:hypothetical protein
MMPPDVPYELRKLANPAEAFVERDDATDWQKACAAAARVALTTTGLDAGCGLAREALRRRPRLLSPRGIDDRLGREVMSELAVKMRGHR